MNIVVLEGSLSRPPAVRDLPSGDRLVAYEVTVRSADQPAESVPVVWLEAPARAAELPAGEVVVVVGRVRRRFFRTPAGTGSRTEVVAESVIPARLRKRSRAATEAARARLATHTSSAFADGSTIAAARCLDLRRLISPEVRRRRTLALVRGPHRRGPP